MNVSKRAMARSARGSNLDNQWYIATVHSPVVTAT